MSLCEVCGVSVEREDLHGDWHLAEIRLWEAYKKDIQALQVQVAELDDLMRRAIHA